MKIVVKQNADLYDKWQKLLDDIESLKLYVRGHCQTITQNDYEIEVEDLKNFKEMCRRADQMTEMVKTRLGNCYNETIQYIKKTNGL